VQMLSTSDWCVSGHWCQWSVSCDHGGASTRSQRWQQWRSQRHTNNHTA